MAKLDLTKVAAAENTAEAEVVQAEPEAPVAAPAPEIKFASAPGVGGVYDSNGDRVE